MNRFALRGAAASLLAGLAAASFAADPEVPGFAAAQPISAATNPAYLLSADFDGDLDLDWATYDLNTSLVKIRRNDGTGLVYSSNGFAPPYGLIDMAVGDFTHDGKPDLALATYGGVFVATNLGVDGNGTLQFSLSTALQRAPLTHNYVAIATGDYDGDLSDDIVTIGGYVVGGGNLSVWLSDGQGGFAAPVDRTYAADIPSALAVGDLTGDGRAEIVVGSINASKLHVYLNPHTTTVDVSSGNDDEVGATLDIESIAVADVTRDGRKDIVVVGSKSSVNGGANVSAEIYPTLVTTSFRHVFDTSFGFEITSVGNSSPGAAIDRCAVADLNGDGFAEIVATYGHADKVAVVVLAAPTRLPSGDVSDVSEFNISTYPAGTAPQRVTTGDFDGDQKIDVLTLGDGANASFLRNTGNSGGGGGGGDANPPAKKLAVKSKAFPPGNRFQDGQKFTFTCEQSAPDVEVLLQHTTTPDVALSWEPLPVEDHFTKGKGTSVKWTLSATHVPAGQRFFRTVTRGGGKEDGVNTAAPTTSDEARYIGPFEVLSKGPVIVFQTSAYPASDYDTRTTTHTGDSIAYLINVANYGTETATNVRIQARVPSGTVLNEALTGLGWAWLDKKHTKIEWTLAELPAKGKVVYAMTVDVTAKKGTVKLDSVSIGMDKPGRSIRDGEGTIKLAVTSPIRLRVEARQSSPKAGELLEYDLTASNLGATTLTSAVAWDRLPRGVSFELGLFVNAAGDPIASPVAAPGGRTNPFFERETRKVFWYLGDMAPGAVQHLRLVTRVQFDRSVDSVLVNGAYELRGASPGRTGVDPLALSTLDVVSPGPHDVKTTVDGPAPTDVPVFFLGSRAVSDDGARLYDKRYGDVALAAPGSEVAYVYYVRNTGGAAAKAVHLKGNLPNQTTLVAGSVKVQPLGGVEGPAQFTVSSGGSLDVDLGTLAPGSNLFVLFRVLVAAKAKDRTMLVSRDFHLETDSLLGIIFSNPSPLNVLVSQPYVPSIETRPETPPDGFVHEGDTIGFVTAFGNVGGRAGSGDLTQTVPAGCSFLDATFFDPNDTEVAKFDVNGNPVGTPTASYSLKPSKTKIAVALGTLVPGASGKARFRFTVAKAPKSKVLTSQAGLGGKVAGALTTKAGTKVPAAVPPTTATAQLRVETDDSPQLFLARVAPHVVRQGFTFTYTCIVGNTSDNDATGVVMTMTTPVGSLATASQELYPDFGNDGAVTVVGLRHKVTWTIGTIPKHSVAVRVLHVGAKIGGTENALIEDSLSVQADNATGWRLSPQASLVVTEGTSYHAFVWPSVQVSTSAIGMVLGTDQPAGLADAIRALDEESASVMSAGADVTQFTNGALIVRIGGGTPGVPGSETAFAFGKKVTITATSGATVNSFGDTSVVVGRADAITVTGIPGHEQTSVAEAFAAPMGLVTAGAANLVVGGSYSQVARDGRTLLGPDGAPIGLVKFTGANLVAAGGGNLVAAGGGNVVPTGAGRLVGNDGSTLVGNDGSTLVAAGGGNLVAAGGGNLVAAGGGNLVAAGAGNLVAAGGGNMVAAGGLNVVPPAGK